MDGVTYRVPADAGKDGCIRPAGKLRQLLELDRCSRSVPSPKKQHCQLLVVALPLGVAFSRGANVLGAAHHLGQRPHPCRVKAEEEILTGWLTDPSWPEGGVVLGTQGCVAIPHT